MLTKEKKRFVKKYTLEDIKAFLASEGFEWCSMQVKDLKTGKCQNGDIKMFNGDPVYAYLRFKKSEKPAFTYLIVTNDEFIIRGQGYSLNLSEYWKPFYKKNQKNNNTLFSR